MMQHVWRECAAGVQLLTTVQMSWTEQRTNCKHANCAPSIAADIDPMVTDMFIQCKNVLSLAAEAKTLLKSFSTRHPQGNYQTHWF